jgi:hypothetical protein
MKTQTLLIFTAVLEILTGIGLILVPALVIRILLGAEMHDEILLTVARVGGSAILSIGIACWFAWKAAQTDAVKPLLTGMLVYNITVFSSLAYSAITYKMTAALLAALVIHLALAIFCLNAVKKMK